MDKPLKKKHIERTLTEAMALHNAGQLAQAAPLYAAILTADAKEPNALLNLSTLYIQLGDYAQAAPLLERLVATQPRAGYAHFALGNLHLRQQHFREAAASYARAEGCEPGNAAYPFNRGIALDAAGAFAEAVLAYERAAQLKPNYREALVNQANGLFRLGRHAEGLALCDRILAANPDLALAYVARANALAALGRRTDALADLDRALALDPNLATAHNNRGSQLEKLDRSRQPEALACYDRALALDPRYVDAHTNRANVLTALSRHEEALASSNEALALNPNYAPAYDRRANALAALRRHEEALADYDRALALAPALEPVAWNKAMLLLLLGNFAEGLPLYETRWQTELLRDHARQYPQPLWLGDAPVEGKDVFVWHEQGFGDFIQMYRYIPLLAARARTVYLEVQPPMLPLVAPVLPPNVVALSPRDTPPRFDCHIPIMSLPLAFGTTPDTVPNTTPYLMPDETKLTKWRGIPGTGRAPRVGIVWSGATAHRNDARRSIPLAMLAPLLTSGAEFHSLQKEVRDSDLPSLPLLTDHRTAIGDFADTAALIAGMDLVISVDTSVAHVAGALGKPLWLLLPYAPDYRWLLDRTDSPWYPTARLFRQAQQDDWPNTIGQVIEALRTQFPVTEG